MPDRIRGQGAPDKGRRTRRHIVEKAAAVFNSRGYSGSSMSDLMHATGLEKGGIYRHFESKEQLAVEAFNLAAQTATDIRFATFEGSELDAIEKLKRFVSQFVDCRSPIPGGCPVLNAAIEHDNGNAAIRTRARGVLRGWLDRLCDAVVEGQRKGEIRESHNPKSVVLFLLSSLEGASAIVRLDKSTNALVSMRDHLYDYLDNLK